MAAFAESWPRFVQPPGSVCFYVQALPRHPSGLRLVVNTVSAGYGRGLSRLRRLVSLADGEVPPRADLCAPQRDVLVAECRGILGGALDVRPATGDRALDYPFAPVDTDLPALNPADLTVRYDGERDRLALTDPDGRAIRPVHLGMTAQYWLPPWLQFLVRTFGEPATAMAPGWVFQAGGDLPPAGTVERRPRLDIGRVTLARACWRLRAGDFPVPAKGEGDAAYLPRLASWLARNGIPRRFFARVVDLRSGLLMSLLSKERKPIYVDVTDMLLLTGLLRAVRDPGALMVLEEALPDLGEAPRYGGERRVTEYVVQLSAPPPREQAR